jgi:uncharacterized membrane protein
MSGTKASWTAAMRGERLAGIKRRQRVQDRVSDDITAFSGSMTFVYLHILWFAVWIVVNVTPWAFDPYPFGLLTLIVSLEAIFLSTFVMISQNRESALSDARDDIDFETNVMSEAWLEAFAEKLGIDKEQVHAAARDRMARARTEEARTTQRHGGSGPA